MVDAEQQGLLLQTTGMLLEAGAGEIIRSDCQIEIDIYSRGRPGRPARLDIVAGTKDFLLAELPLAVAGIRTHIGKSEMHEDTPPHAALILDLVKIVPDTLEIYRNHGVMVAAYKLEDDATLGEIEPDSSMWSSRIADAAFEVYKLQDEFGWQPVFNTRSE